MPRAYAPRCAQCRRDGAKCPCAITIERKNIEVRLGLLQVLLTGAALGIVARYVRTDGKLGERYCANRRFIGKLGGSDIWPRRITVEVSSIPLARSFCHSDGRSDCRCRAGAHLGSPAEDSCGDE